MNNYYFFPKQEISLEKLSPKLQEQIAHQVRNLYFDNDFEDSLSKKIDCIIDKFTDKVNKDPNIHIELDYPPMVFDHNSDLTPFFRLDFGSDETCYDIDSTYFLKNLIADLSGKAPFNEVSYEELKQGLTSSYLLSFEGDLAADYQDYSYRTISTSDGEVCRGELMEKLCNSVLNSKSLCNKFDYDPENDELDDLKRHITRYIEDRATEICVSDLHEELLDHIDSEFDTEIKKAINQFMYSVLNFNSYSYLSNIDIDELLKQNPIIDVVRSEPTESFFTFNQKNNQLSKVNTDKLLHSEDYVLEGNFVISGYKELGYRIFETCEKAENFMLEYLKPNFEDQQLLVSRNLDELYKEVISFLNITDENTLYNLHQQVNALKENFYYLDTAKRDPLCAHNDNFIWDQEISLYKFNPDCLFRIENQAAIAGKNVFNSLDSLNNNQPMSKNELDAMIKQSKDQYPTLSKEFSKKNSYHR